MKIVYVHGANSSLRSFRFIQYHLPEHEQFNFEYTVDQPMIDNINGLQNFIKNKVKGNYSFVSHSMGGLLSAKILEQDNNARCSLSMSTPYGGSRFIDYLRWICPGYQMFKDLRVTSPIIRSFSEKEINKPIFQIVTSGGGNPLFKEPNDGTVSVTSQLAIKKAEFKHYEDLNHFEVLLSNRIVEDIKTFLF